MPSGKGILIPGEIREAGRGTPFAIDEITPDDLLDWQLKEYHEIVWASSQLALDLLDHVYGVRA